MEEQEREATVTTLTAQYRKHAGVLNAARLFEIDDVIDPARTRTAIASTVRAARA
jgi:acetyl-CoA carboxylase carboxyltransferase component